MRCPLWALPILILGACFDEPPPVNDGGVAEVSFDAPDTAEATPEVEVGPACVTDCGAGVCDEESGLCVCETGWIGSACTTCGPGYFGPSCQGCACAHGECDDGDEGSGACACEPGWAGGTCEVDLSVPWSEGPYGSEDGSLAGDVTFPTEGGTFSLLDEWTGQDSFLFLFHYTLADESLTLWSGDPGDLLGSLPENVHLVFGSLSDDHEIAVASMKARVQTALDAMSTQARAHWAARVHFVSGKALAVAGPLSERISASSSYKFAIDRYQRWRALGSLYETAVEASSLTYLGHEPWGYNAEHHVRSAAAVREGISLQVFHGVELVAGEAAEATVTLPTTEQLQGLDSLAVAIHVHCEGEAEGTGGGCATAPNTLGFFVCDDTGECGAELARVVAPYARAGSWLVDADPLLPLLDGGGPTTFRLVAEYAAQVEVALVLSDAGRPERASEVIGLWNHPQGVAFDEAYCTTQPTFDVEAPSGASRIELVTRLTGHGEGATIDKCAALCDHAHHMGVGDTVVTVDFAQAGVEGACLDLPGGVTPNQFGDWTLGRAGWCPGAGVVLGRTDVTDALGLAQTLTYQADRDGEPYAAWVVDPQGSMPSIRMASWLVAYVERETVD